MKRNSENGRQKVKLTFAVQAGPPMQKATEAVVSDIFCIGFVESITGFKIILYYFDKGVLTETVWKDSIDDMFKRIPERSTNLFSFTDAFTQRSLYSPRFLWPIANFIRKNLKDQVKITKLNKGMTDNALTLPGSPSSQSKSSNE